MPHSLCFYTYKSKESCSLEDIEWHLVNFAINYNNTRESNRNQTTTPQLVSPPSSLPHRSFVPSSAASWGPYAFLHLGFNSNILKYDTRDGSYSSLPPMSVRKINPFLAVIDDRLFVLGGTGFSDSKYWGEVFNIELNQWQSLPPPPPVIPMGSRYLFGAVDHGNRLILIANTKLPRPGPADPCIVLHSFHVDSLHWQIFDVVDSKVDFYGKGVVDDGVLYYFNGEKLCCYVIHTRDVFKSDIGILGSREDNVRHPYLLHHLTGDRFLLVFYDTSLDCKESSENLVHCMTIKAGFDIGANGNVFFAPVVEVFQSHVIDPRKSFGYAFLVYHDSERKSGGEYGRS